MGDGRSDGDKSDWLCKHCTTASSVPFKNYGNRVHCHKCGIAKNKAFLRVATSPQKPPTTSSVAESQKRVKQLEAQLVGEKEANKKNEARLRQRPATEAVEMVVDEEPAKGYSMEQIKNAKAFYLGCGEAGKEDLERVEVQIAAAQEASLAKKPGSELVRYAERRVARAKKACETGKEKLAALEKSLGERAVEKITEDAELLEAETAYQAAAKALQPEVEAGPSTIGGLQSVCVGFSDEFYTRAGLSREQANVLLKLMSTEQLDMQKRQKAKDTAEEEAKQVLEKGQKDKEAANAAVQRELASTKQELAKLLEASKKEPDPVLVGDAAVAAADRSYAADVDVLLGELLGAAGLDATIKRDLETKLDLLGKRRKTG